jgi:hypothetical protein
MAATTTTAAAPATTMTTTRDGARALNKEMRAGARDASLHSEKEGEVSNAPRSMLKFSSNATFRASNGSY